MLWTWRSLWTKESELSCLGAGKVCETAKAHMALSFGEQERGWAKDILMCVVQGTLKGYDQLLNLVMDETIEYLRGKLASACMLLASGSSRLPDNVLCLKTLKTLSEYLIKHGVWVLW